jgi:transcriptional regulator with XRE-family HTH domain
MTSRERPVDRGSRIARSDLTRVGVELRIARTAAGLSLDAVGAAAGLSGPQVSRIERGMVAHGNVLRLARIGAVVGLDVRVRAFPGPDPVRDVGQLRLLTRFAARLPPHVTLRAEVPISLGDDQRAWDGRVDGLEPVGSGGRHLVVEADTRLADVQAQLRRLRQKCRDGGEPHVLWVLAETRANRAAIDAASAILTDLFPVSGRDAMRSLAAGRHPGGSAIVFL